MHYLRVVVTLALTIVSAAAGGLATAEEKAGGADTTTAADTTALISVDAGTVAIDSVRVADAHPQDSPAERGFLIRTPDGKASLRIRGSIRLTGLYDFNGLQSKDVFATYDIPVGAANRAEPRFVMDAKQTRLGFEVERDSKIGPVFLRIEGDFFGSGDPEGNLRLRHAYGTLRGFLLGQTWTTFSDVSALPLTVDFEGPNSAVTIRTPQVRYTFDFGTNREVSLAIENPATDFAAADTTGTGAASAAFQSFGDVIVRARRDVGNGHLQTAGVFRSLTYRDANDELRFVPGYGLQVSGRLGLPRDYLVMFQALGGQGIERYITALTGRGLDLVLNPNTLELEALGAFGSYLALAKDWTRVWESNIVIGLTHIFNKDYQPDDAFKRSVYVAINTFTSILPGTRLGLEYLWGQRENKDGARGDANRIQFAMYYDF